MTRTYGRSWRLSFHATNVQRCCGKRRSTQTVLPQRGNLPLLESGDTSFQSFHSRRHLQRGLVRERQHSDSMLSASWHDGCETGISVTFCAALWKLCRVGCAEGRPLRFAVGTVRESAPDLHTINQDNQVIDSIPGVVPAACSDDSKLCDDTSTCPAVVGSRLASTTS